jgi:tetratricopeptide (TPR) repeat protein
MKKAAWLFTCLAVLGACATPGVAVPESAFLARPLAFRPGDEDTARVIAGLEIKEDWAGLSAVAVQALSRRPVDQDWLVVLGYARMRAGDYPSAIELLQRVADQSPEDSDARNLLGEALRLSGQVERAVEVMEKATLSTPNSHQGWFTLGEAYTSAGRLERARQAYRQAVSLEPQYVAGWYALVAILARVGPREEYEGALERLRALRPELAAQHPRTSGGPQP